MANIHRELFTNNYTFQEGYYPQIKDIIKRNAHHMMQIDVAASVQDTKQSTDMVIRVEAGVDIAVRIRRPDCKFRDLTIRARSHYNQKTELHKLREGWGDWYIYAWADDKGVLSEWILVNIHTLRKAELLSDNRKITGNKGDNTGFINITLPELFTSKALVAGVILRGNGYWHHMISSDIGRVWQASAYSILEPAA